LSSKKIKYYIPIFENQVVIRLIHAGCMDGPCNENGAVKPNRQKIMIFEVLIAV
jgi:hypothetical protein